MASIYFISPKINDFYNKIRNASEDAESNRRIEFSSAKIIQASARRFLIRCYIKKLNYCAVIIQCRYRGWLGRKYYRKYLETAVLDVNQKFYNRMAILIQKTWRGYYSRSRVFSFYSLQLWISKVQMKNAEVLEKVSANTQVLEQEMYNDFEQEAQKCIRLILLKLHHLLRTRTISGIYSDQYSSELSTFEELLKTMQYPKYMQDLKAAYNKCLKQSQALAETCENFYWCRDKTELFDEKQLEKIMNNKKLWQIDSLSLSNSKNSTKTHKLLQGDYKDFNNKGTIFTMMYIEYHINKLLKNNFQNVKS